MDVLGLPWHLGRGEALEHHGGISYMKGGILFAERDHRRLAAIRAGDPGPGDGIRPGRACCARARGDLVGILNGVDYDGVGPAARPAHRARAIRRDDLSGKAAVQGRPAARRWGCPRSPTCPWSGSSRGWSHQKGFDIVVGAWYDLLQRPLRMVVLGTGEPRVQEGFRALAERAPDRFAVRFAYDEALAHKIEAGADMFLMPSRFEPCGLTQMYSLRYGTVPIVRATGGLVDTVEPWDPATGPRHRLPLRQPRRHRRSCGPSTRPWAPARTGGLEATHAQRHGEGLLLGPLGARVRRGHAYHGSGPALYCSGSRLDWRTMSERSRPSPTRTGRPR